MKKNNYCLLICLLALGCNTSRLSIGIGETKQVSWAEKPNRSVADINFGIPAVTQTAVQYKRYNVNTFSVQLSEPQVIVVADKPQGWGYYQFPNIGRLANGDIHASWNLAPDAIESYGLGSVGSAISKDGAKTWQYAVPDSSQITGYKLANGEMIRVVDPKPVKVSAINMPAAIGKTNFRYRKTNFTFYRLNDMPTGVNGIFFNRMAKGGTQWKLEQAKLTDPKAVRYSSRDLVPIVWWGDIHTMKDGSLLAGVYPGYYIKDNGEIDKQMGVVFHRSTDGGHSWKFQGRIPFTPDRTIDAMASDRIGFSEPTYEVLPDGSLLCVIRSADGDGVTNGVGNGPLYASRSTDMGVTWSRPEAISPAGALPRLLTLKNGVIVLSSGRPGVQIRFNKTGNSKTWTDPLEMLPYDSKSMEVQYAVSCGYTGLLATGPNRFLMIYSDFKHKNAAGEERKAIKVREVIVDPK